MLFLFSPGHLGLCKASAPRDLWCHLQWEYTSSSSFVHHRSRPGVCIWSSFFHRPPLSGPPMASTLWYFRGGQIYPLLWASCPVQVAWTSEESLRLLSKFRPRSSQASLRLMWLLTLLSWNGTSALNGWVFPALEISTSWHRLYGECQVIHQNPKWGLAPKLSSYRPVAFWFKSSERAELRNRESHVEDLTSVWCFLDPWNFTTHLVKGKRHQNIYILISGQEWVYGYGGYGMFLSAQVSCNQDYSDALSEVRQCLKNLKHKCIRHVFPI